MCSSNSGINRASITDVTRAPEQARSWAEPAVGDGDHDQDDEEPGPSRVTRDTARRDLSSPVATAREVGGPPAVPSHQARGDIQGRWWSSTTHVDCPPGSACVTHGSEWQDRNVSKRPSTPRRVAPWPRAACAWRRSRWTGDRQQLADRLDPEPVPVGVDEGDHMLGRRSSSAPKKAAADFRISLARRSSRFSRSKRWSR